MIWIILKWWRTFISRTFDPNIWKFHLSVSTSLGLSRFLRLTCLVNYILISYNSWKNNASYFFRTIVSCLEPLCLRRLLTNWKTIWSEGHYGLVHQEHGREIDINPRLSRLICVINLLLFSFNSALFEGQSVSSVFRVTFTRASNFESFKNIISWQSFN